MDQFAEMLATHFFDTKIGLTVYREQYGRADKDNGDNGVYVLDENLNICKRIHKTNYEEVDTEKTQAIFENIISKAPAFNF